jgi:hypothetical protein
VNGFTVKAANPKFAPASHVFECVLSQAAVVTAIEDDSTFPPIDFNVTPLDILGETTVMSLVDIAGVVIEIGICEGYLRGMEIQASSEGSNSLTQPNPKLQLLFGGQVQKPLLELCIVHFLEKGLRRGEYMGRPSLPQLPSSVTMLDSQNPIAVELDKWFAGIKKQYDL